jgi:diguanylate cyclase (GGDEF)-like protein
MTPVLMSPSGYPLPAAEDERLAEVLAHGLLDGPRPDELDRVCALAQSLFDAPGALVTLIGRDEQQILASQGPIDGRCDRRDAFCAWTIASEGVLVIHDAARDPRFSANPLVTGEAGVRFYAGAPLTVRPGVSLGALCILDTRPRAFSDEDGQRLAILAELVVADLTKRRALIELSRREALVTRAAHLTKIGSWAYDVAAERMSWSPETCGIVGLPEETAPSCAALLDCFIEGEPRVWAKQAFRDLLATGVTMDRELELFGPMHGVPRWIRCLAEAERAEAGGEIVRIVGSVQDVTERREAEARIERLAYRDGLTGLPNRALFQQTVVSAVEAAARRGGKVGLLLLDLDHFKDVNDSLGHEIGDALLCSVADRLEGAYRKTDMVARLGGDEFAVILPNINGPDDLIRPTAKVMDLLRKPLEHDGRSLSITASVGAAIYPDGEDDAAQLLKNAEIALFRAKASGRNRIVTYEPEMRYAVERRMVMLREVREGLKRGEFSLHYQPVADIGEGPGVSTVQGFEALTRWRHPVRGLLTPEAFMEAFDDQALSLQLGEATLEGALSQMRAWMDAGVEFGRVAVNVSAAQFRTGRLAATILEKLTKWNVPAERLCIEVTENVYMGWGAEVVGDAARELHAAGVQIALDDFGTGYASLTHLKSFPIDRLKIDRSFVQNEADSAIVSAVITLGSGLGMKVIAEGVETQAQLDFLRRAGCDQAQGYHLGYPMPAADIPAYLATHAARPPRAKLRLA